MTGLRMSLATLVAAALAAPLAAQGSCDLYTRSADQIALVRDYIAKHDQATDSEERLKILRLLVRGLTDTPPRIKSEAGRSFLLGTVYARWLLDQKGDPVLRAKRGDVGLRDNPEDDFVFPLAFNETMAVVEREGTACADSTAKFRNAAFVKLLNGAIASLNATSNDLAIDYANAALQVGPRAAQASTAYQVLARASEAKGDLAGAIAGLQKVVDGMATDATGAPARATALFNLAVFTRDHAMKQAGPARAEGLRRAHVLFASYTQAMPDGPNAAAARAASTRILQEIGDTESVAGVYADMLVNPSKYTALQLFEAGVASANGKKYDDAARLYEAGLQANPHYRDALFNAANVYFALRQPDKMAPLVDRLRAIDPMNADVLKLAGAVWQKRGNQASDPRSKRQAQDSVSALVDRAARLPARVVVSQFTVGRDHTTTLAGSVENLGSALASFAVTFDLLDNAGAVVGSMVVNVEGVAPRATAAFSVQATGASPVAWRYTVR